MTVLGAAERNFQDMHELPSLVGDAPDLPPTSLGKPGSFQAPSFPHSVQQVHSSHCDTVALTLKDHHVHASHNHHDHSSHAIVGFDAEPLSGEADVHPLAVHCHCADSFASSTLGGDGL